MKFSQLDEVAAEFKIGSKGSDWMVLETGDNKVRIVSEYEPLAKHFAGKGQKPVTCVGEKNGCIRCNDMKEWEEEHKNDIIAPDKKKPVNPNKPTVKFLIWVIDRRDGKFKIAEFGWSVVKAIGDLEKDAEWGFNKTTALPDYDLTIKKTVKDASPSGTEYSVVPSRINKPLTPEEEAQLKELTPIKKIVDSIKGKVLKEYEAMVLIPGAGTPPAADAVPPASRE
jgi:hypothetical protein